ncbi:MAG: hypothetical protein ACK4SO_06320 [Candidatus Kapaibacteriota bacterium]
MSRNKFLVVFLSFLLIAWSFPFDALSYKGGRGSFGGTRSSVRSFGGSKSFGGTRMYRTPTTKPGFTTPMGTYRTPQTRSFGGSATSLLNKSYIQSKYGTPRRVLTPRELPNLPSNVRVYDYGNFASGLMMGYLMGQTSWLWYLPFHPAFYYTQPIKVVNEDGTVSYYPPTFDASKFVMTLTILGSIGFIFYQILKRRRSSGAVKKPLDLSRSSFS